MPAIVGAIKILTIGSGSIVHIGDSVQLAPRSTAKTYAGAGSFITGDYVRTYNHYSSTNVLDKDFIDSSPISFDKAGGL